MLENCYAFAGFSIRNVEETKTFYGDILGLPLKEHYGMLELHLPDGKVLMYPKENHEPAAFTVLNFEVTDIENLIRGLKAKGVPFESYDNPEYATDENHIMHHGNFKAAWFKDPSGNILSIMEGQMEQP